MKDAQKKEFGKDLLKKPAGEGPIFPMLVMTQPSFPSMKPVTPFRYRVGA